MVRKNYGEEKKHEGFYGGNNVPASLFPEMKSGSELEDFLFLSPEEKKNEEPKFVPIIKDSRSPGHLC